MKVPTSAALDLLRQGAIIKLQDKKWQKVPSNESILKKGDLFVADRNGPVLCRARLVDEVGGFVMPEGPPYAYQLAEIVKVREFV